MTRVSKYWLLGIITCASATVAVFLVVGYARSREFRQAAEWHKLHGSEIVFDEHKLTLPQDWWKKSEYDGEKGVLAKASRDLMSLAPTEIILDRKALDESEKSKDEIIRKEKAFIEIENKGKDNPRYSMLVVRAASTDMYCIRTLMVGQNVQLRCDVIGVPIIVSSIGALSTQSEVETILSTFQ